jgi:hypothetical protein
MSYSSDKQRKYLHSQKPEVAAKFDRDIKKMKRAEKRHRDRDNRT